MGIEQPQLAAIGEIFEKGAAATPPTVKMTDLAGKTINQDFLAVALGLSTARLWPKLMSRATAAKNAEDFFALQAEHGHQCRGTGFDADEQAAYDPHAELWGGGWAGGLREARLAKDPQLLAFYLGWGADHLAMIRPFWTPRGFRSPGARCLTPAGMPLRPSAVWDSRLYALVALEIDGDAAKAKYGNVSPPAQAALACLRDSSSLFAEIEAESKTAHLKLAMPVRKWTQNDGGYVAAFASDSQAIDNPVARMIVSAAGEITDAERLLAGFVEPAGVPYLFGGPGGAVASVMPAIPGVPGAAPPPSPPATVAGRLAPTHAKESLIQRIEAWLKANL
jgi:hypothetical protein